MEQLRGLILFPLVVLFSCSFWDVIAIDCGGNQITHTIVVDQSGKGEFRTVQPAIDSTKQNNVQWVKVHINAGTCTEKVEIPLNKPCVFLEGAGKEVTTVVYDGQPNSDWNATFTSGPPNVVVIGITFKNSYNLAGPKPLNQALAAAVYGEKCVFYKCGFIGFQDTLFDASGSHYFKDCYIQGEVGFIFGSGQSYYENCEMNVTKGTYPGFVKAQCRGSEEETRCFVFRRGRVSGSGEVSLGRAWGPYSSVVFYGTYFSTVVSPQGWDARDYVGKESKFTYDEIGDQGLILQNASLG